MLGALVGVGDGSWHCTVCLPPQCLTRGPFTLPLHIPCSHSLPLHTCSLCTLHTRAPLPCLFLLEFCCPEALVPFAHLSLCTLVPMCLFQRALAALAHSVPFPARSPSVHSPLAHSFPFHSHSLCLCSPLAHSGPLQLVALLGLFSSHTHSLPHLLLVHTHFPGSFVSFIRVLPFHSPHALAHFSFPSTLPALHACHSQRAMRPNKPRERFIPFAPRIPNPSPNAGSGGCRPGPPGLELCFTPTLRNPRFGVPPTRTEAPFPRAGPPRVIFTAPRGGSFSLSSLPLPKVSSWLPGPPVYSQIPDFFVCPAVIFHRGSKSVNSRIAHLKNSCPAE